MDAVALQHIKKSHIHPIPARSCRARRGRAAHGRCCAISVCFPIGQLTVIVGRSGCGKSTLFEAAGRKGAAGRGTDRDAAGLAQRASQPDPYVITWTNVQRNVAMACGVGKDAGAPRKRPPIFVRLVGLRLCRPHPRRTFHGHEAAAGRARVLASQAQLLLMDEPFASLDFLTRGELQSQLLAIQKKAPRTIVLVTHQLEEALLLGQKIVVMHPDSTIREFDLSALPYPRDVEQPVLRALKAEITDECRKPTASE